MRTRLHIAAPLIALAITAPHQAKAQAAPTPGPVIASHGPVFPVSPDFDTPLDLDYRVAFDIAQTGGTDGVSTSLNTVARFLNMHGRAGVPEAQLGAAVVVHGTAVMDVLSDEAYHARAGSTNPNGTLLRELLDAGVRVVVCGQSAASRGYNASELADGVELALSAMTAFVVLQNEGYLVNPW
jgi:intracellular sulfur oxidation DsrE/DsrF family protein